MTPPTCAIHPSVVLRCLACAGAKGGKATTPKKQWHARQNIKRAHEPKKKGA